MTSSRFAAYLTLLALPLALLLFVAPNTDEAESNPDPPAPPTAPASTSESRDAFGLPTTPYAVDERRVRRGETFADLLQREDVPYADIVQLAEATRDLFDVRDIRAGYSYQIYRNRQLQQTDYLVYQRDASRYVVYDIRDPEQSYVGERPVSVSWKTAGGTITSSLYETLQDEDLHPMIALKLSEVFAWQIDFFRIRSGDAFRVIYEDRQLDGESLAPGSIVAARFTHRGDNYYAFHFDEGARSDYFDEAGNSLRRQLLKAPLKYSRVSSRYSPNRLHPVTGKRRAHLGTDYAAPPGTPVRSVGDGTVVTAGYDGANGNWVKVRHNSTYTTGYLHLSRIASGIRRGASVEQGQTIGYVGSTGLATGPHLHYHFWKNGTPIDPFTLELPPVRPVNPQFQGEFAALVERLKPRLDADQPPPLLTKRAPLDIDATGINAISAF